MEAINDKLALQTMVAVQENIAKTGRISDVEEYREAIGVKNEILEYRAMCVSREFRAAAKVATRVIERVAKATKAFEKSHPELTRRAS